MSFHRDAIADQIELVMLRQAVQGQEDDPNIIVRLKRRNGSAH
jgi:hypothetical protein